MLTALSLLVVLLVFPTMDVRVRVGTIAVSTFVVYLLGNQSLLLLTEVNFTFGRIKLYLLDLLSILIYIEFIRYRWKERPRMGQLPAVKRLIQLVEIYIAIGLVTWTLREGYEVAGANWRIWIYGCAVFRLGSLCTLVLKYRVDVLLRPLVIAGFLSIVTFSLLYGFGGAASRVYVGDQLVDGRAISAGIAMSAGLFIITQTRQTLPLDRLRIDRALSVLAFLVILLGQHRTVWMVLSVAFAHWVFSRTGPKSLVVKLFSLPLLPLPLIALSKIGQFEASASNLDTFDWRVARWATSFGIKRSTLQWLFGELLGPTPVSDFNSHEYYAHSAYVSALESLGIVGAVGLLTLLIVALISVFRSSRLQTRFLLTGIVFGITYRLGLEFWFVAGALAAIDRRQIHKSEKFLKVGPLLGASFNQDAQESRAVPPK